MVQPNEIPEENMVSNIIDEVQSEIDNDLKGAPSSDAQFNDQVQRAIDAQMPQVISQVRNEFQSQISGQQSLQDKGLNAIRRDTDTRIVQLENELKGYQNRDREQQFLGGLDMSQREVAEPLLQEMARRDETNTQQLEQMQRYMAQNQSVQTQQPEVPPSYQQEIRAVVQNMGVNPDDQNVNYSVLQDYSKTQEQRSQIFLQSVTQAAILRDREGSQGQSSTQTPAAQADPQAQTPPMENSRQGGNGSHNNMDELLDWYLTIGSPSSEQQVYYNQKFEQFS
jgi:hypothetical protein